MVILVLLFIACENALSSPNNKAPELGELLDPIEKVRLNQEASNTTLIAITIAQK